jgi:hypothetical protein
MATRKPIALVSGYFQEVNTPTDKLDFAGNTTTDLAEGTNLYYTDARARGSITIANSGTGYGSLGYVSGTGVLTYTVVTDANIRGTLTVAAGSGLTYSSATGQFGTSAIPNSQLAFSSVTVGSTSISLGGTATTIAGLTAVTSTAFNVGTAEAAGSITLDSTGIVFEGSTADTFETTFNVVDPTADRAINLPNASGTVALLTSLTGGNTGTGYGSLSYNNTTGAFTYSVVTDANIRGAVSAANSGTGFGSLAFDSGTGVFTYTVVTAANVRGNFSVAVGSGLTYSSSTGIFGTSAIPNSQLANSSVTLGSTSVALGSTATSLAGLTSVSTAAGSTAAPSFVVGTGTTYAPGIYSPGADQVAVATSGVGRLFVDATGRVGVGTASPAVNLTVTTAASGEGLRLTNGTNGERLHFYTGSNSLIEANNSILALTARDAYAVTLSTSNAERLRVTSTGLVGIGTTSATGKLTVSGNAVGVIVVLTDGATITPDFSTANYFSVTLGGNRTLANPSNQTAGQSGTIVITQDGTGGRTLAYGSNYKFPGGDRAHINDHRRSR